MLHRVGLLFPVAIWIIALVALSVKQPNGSGLLLCRSRSTWHYHDSMSVGTQPSQTTRLFKLKWFACPLGLKHGFCAGFIVAIFRMFTIRVTLSSCARLMKGCIRLAWRRYSESFPSGVGRRTVLPKRHMSNCCATVGMHFTASTGPRIAGCLGKMPVRNRACAIVGSVLGTIGAAPPSLGEIYLSKSTRQEPKTNSKMITSYGLHSNFLVLIMVRFVFGPCSK